MHSISELQNIIRKSFDPEVVKREPSELYDPIAYTLNLGANVSGHFWCCWVVIFSVETLRRRYRQQ